MKPILTTLLLLAALLIPTHTATSKPSLQNEVKRSIVRIDIGDLSVDHGICTGFVVSSSKGEALTAAHCLPEGDDPIYIDGEVTTVIRQDQVFGLVAIEKMKKPPLPIREEEAEIGEEVWTFGYAWGQLSVFHRYVASFLKGDTIMDNPIAPGMSGGPVVNAKGEVVGLNQAANNVVGVACGAAEIRAFLSAEK